MALVIGFPVDDRDVIQLINRRKPNFGELTVGARNGPVFAITQDVPLYPETLGEPDKRKVIRATAPNEAEPFFVGGRAPIALSEDWQRLLFRLALAEYQGPTEEQIATARE